MRRGLLALAVTAMVLPLAPARATHARVVEATIELAAGGQPESRYSLWACLADPDHPVCRKSPTARPQRCLYVTDPAMAQTNSTGRLGYVIELGPEDADGAHSFTLTDATAGLATLDFDVTFYSSLGTCVVVGNPIVPIDCFPLVGEYPEPCLGSGPPQFGRFGPDSGRIYAGMRFAIVTLFAGANGTFRFEIT